MSDSFKNTIFRLQNGNDVRGAAIETKEEAKTLTPSIAQFIADGFIVFLAKKLKKKPGDLRIGVGHDSRITASVLKEAVLKGLSSAHTYDCSLITTPAMFQSTVLEESNFDGAIMITASHLPFNRNGMKFFTKEGAIEHDELTKLLGYAVVLADKHGIPDQEEIISAEKLPVGGVAPELFDMKSLYSRHMKALIKESVQAEDYHHPLAGLRIVVDAGNGASGFFAENILQDLGANIDGSVFLDPDGNFPNHVPNPENKQAMDAIRTATVDANADLGVIFDCDGDRGAVVFADGTEVNRNVLIALLSAIIAEEYPHSTVVTDSVTSDELQEFLEQDLGMKHLRFKRGYKNVIAKGIELNQAGEECRLAIETSGHGAFKENYFSDDGAYIALRIICHMAKCKKEGKDMKLLISNLKSPAESEEIRFKISDPDFATYGQQVLDEFLDFAKQDERFCIVEPNYEGIRISFDDSEVKGWMLLRMSLHDPVLPMNLESSAAGGNEVILNRILPFFAKYEKLTRS